MLALAVFTVSLVATQSWLTYGSCGVMVVQLFGIFVWWFDVVGHARVDLHGGALPGASAHWFLLLQLSVQCSLPLLVLRSFGFRRGHVGCVHWCLGCYSQLARLWQWQRDVVELVGILCGSSWWWLGAPLVLALPLLR